MKKEITPAGLLNLFVVYIVWGSTYLAIRFGVREGAGFPPFTFGFLRVATAGVLLLLWGKFRGKAISLTWRDFLTLLGSGLLLWIGGNGLVVLGEQRIDSSLAALIISSTPIWVAAYEAVLDKRLPSWRTVAALLVGFSGILVLSFPIFISGVQADARSVFMIVGASLSWGLGTVLQSRRPTQLSTVVSSGYQQLIGGIAFGILALVFREPRPTPIPEAWLALAYLLVFGSLLAFTSYVTALQILPTKIVMTYPYVNPVIAMFLGWLLLREPITPWTIGGAGLVLLGVAGVFRERRKSVASD